MQTQHPLTINSKICIEYNRPLPPKKESKKNTTHTKKKKTHGIVQISPLRGGGGGGLSTEISNLGGYHPPTPKNISARNF
jgi:hypothetical protein